MEPHPDFRFSPRPNRAHEIAWRPWGEAAFAEARRLGRPILLSLSAVWCHWCHVMDETSYSDERVITVINRDFLPIRVDNDRRPDVNRRYNMGGWPTTAFLAANGDVIAGATYIPPGQMLQALERTKRFFAANRTALLALDAAERARAADPQAARALLGGVPGPHPPDPGVFAGDPDAPGDIPAEIALQIVRTLDPHHGGLGAAPKFPQPEVFAFLLAYVGLRPTGMQTQAPDAGRPLEARHAARALRVTLERMARGGLYDHVGGGFFRYATRRDWSEPHYEKMLEDNARLASLYLEAATLAGSTTPEAASLRATASGVVDYLVHGLGSGAGPAFAGSQDADEEYYRLDAEARAARAAPEMDATVYVDWNALAARALYRAAAVLERPELAARADDLLGHLWQHAGRDGFLPHYLEPNGAAAPQAPLLTDQVTAAAAMLDAYEHSAERIWLQRAQTLTSVALERLRAPDRRVYDRLSAPGESPGLLARPLPVLEENALLADSLLRTSAYSGDEQHRSLALDVLAAWAPRVEEHGVAAAGYGVALLRYLERPDHIVVVGSRSDPAARRLVGAALAAPLALRTVQLLDPDHPDDAARLRAAGLDAAAGGAERSHAEAYACRGNTCSRFTP